MAQDGLTEKQQFWLFHVESFMSSGSGLSMRDYADHNDLDVKQFYFWKRQLKALGLPCEDSKKVSRTKSRPSRIEMCAADQRSTPFIRATIRPANKGAQSEPQEPSCAARIILTNGIRIDIPEGIAPDALGALICAAMQVTTSQDTSAS
mgnify:CR=1 FL=1